MFSLIQFQFKFSLVILSLNFNLEIKLRVKTRLATETCKNRDYPPAHDPYTSWYFLNTSHKMTPRRSKNVAGPHIMFIIVSLTVTNLPLFILQHNGMHTVKILSVFFYLVLKVNRSG